MNASLFPTVTYVAAADRRTPGSLSDRLENGLPKPMCARSRQMSLAGLESSDSAQEKLAEGLARQNPTKPRSEPVHREPQPESLEGWTIYVVDANSLIFQVYHALPEMTSSRGEPVAAVYGFARDLLFLLEDKKPDCLICAFDLPGPTFRDAIYDQYKAGRGEMPDDLSPQFPKIYAMLEALNIPSLTCEGYEADDILATVATQCEQLGGNCLLVSGDKDCRQLLSDRVQIFNVRKNLVYDADALRGEWGVRPDQVVDFQTLVGDSVDNVPGVPLIGPKIAGQLLASYDTLESVLAHADEVQGTKRRENLIAARETALVSRQLVRLDRCVPIEIDWLAGRPGNFDHVELSRLFAEFGFRSLSERVVRLGSDAPAPAWQSDYRIVDTAEKFDQFMAELVQQKRLSVDTETTHIWPRWAEIVGYSFSWREGEAYYLPVKGPPGEPLLDSQKTLDALRPVLENSDVEKIGQNLKYDGIVLRNVGVELRGIAFDSMLASYLLDAGERNHNLDDLALRYLSHQTIKIGDLIGRGKNQKRMDEVPISQVGPYAAEDADVPLRLRSLLEQRLQKSGLERLFHDVEIPLIDVLADMESTGVRVNVDRLAEMSDQFGTRIDQLESEIHELAGRTFNIASPKQLAEILFNELGLPIVKKTKTGPSTDAEVLEILAAEHPLPAKILEYRQFAKLKNTYLDALPAMVHPQTGRIHAAFNQVVAATGRLSSSDPNLQNIPIRTEAGRQIRSAFVPGEPGWLLLAADYSQIELRVLAHFSGDDTLREAFLADEDIHARVASEVYGVALSDVTAEMRRSAKAVNFGVLYGQSAFGLSRALSIGQEEAAEFIDAYFERYPGVEEFLKKTLATCRENGYVTTILGRRRAIRGVRAEAGRNRNLPERTAINTVVQGSAADLIKLAMLSVHTRLRREKFAARMLLQIHDELIFEVPPNELHDLGNLVTREMTDVLDLNVPLKVDLKSGKNWSDCEPW